METAVTTAWRAVIEPGALVWLVVLSVNCLALGRCLAESSDQDAAALRVMTLNMAHGRAMARTQAGIARKDIELNLDRIAQLIRYVTPDVVALQEADSPSTWSGGFSHVDYVAARAALPSICHGRHVDIRLFPVSIRYGAALLATETIDGCRSRAFHVGRRDTKGFVVASAHIESRTVTLVSVHLDYRSAQRRMAQAKKLVDDLQKGSGPITPMIMLGDFNTDGREADALRYVCDALNLTRFAPDATDPSMATYPADDPNERIDWILISDALRFIRCEVRDDLVSDHRAVWADVGWR